MEKIEAHFGVLVRAAVLALVKEDASALFYVSDDFKNDIDIVRAAYGENRGSLWCAGKGKGLYFWKAGHNYGYHSLLFMFPNIGKGVVIMTNSETGDTVINYLVALIAHKYHWPYYFPFFDEPIKMPVY